MNDIIQGREALLQMLQTRRPGGSKTERAFIRQWLEPLGVERDPRGNLIKQIGDAPVLWSCHTDTVHYEGGRQKLVMTESGLIFLSDDERASNCLGADCTAGVWIMREMMLRNVPGLYIFHRDEESGGHGSRYIAQHTPELLANIKFAIAFDRKGYEDVITHQFTECCSQGFAEALAGQLGGTYKPDDTGVFTDTANYDQLVPECTNISVGYFHQHTKDELLDMGFLDRLLEKITQLDVDALPVIRDPSEPGYYPGVYGGWGNDEWDDYGITPSKRMGLADLVVNNPDAVASFLTEWGITADDLCQIIFHHSGGDPVRFGTHV